MQHKDTSERTADETKMADEKSAATGKSSRQSFKDDGHPFTGVAAALASGFPVESRENLEDLFFKGRVIYQDAKNYINEHPAEAAGLIAASGAILWALLGTKPGRHVVELGSPRFSQWLVAGINETLQVQPKNLQ